MRICGLVRPPVRSVMASHSGVSPLTKISCTSTPLRSSKAFARWHQGHCGWEYITTCAGMAQVLSSVGTLCYCALHIAAASEDAAGGILVVQFSTDHLLHAVPPQVDLSRE